jgi:hypothetical protein
VNYLHSIEKAEVLRILYDVLNKEFNIDEEFHTNYIIDEKSVKQLNIPIQSYQLLKLKSDKLKALTL